MTDQRPDDIIQTKDVSCSIHAGGVTVNARIEAVPVPPSRFKRISEIIRWIRDGEYVLNKLPENWWQDLTNWINSFFPFSRKSIRQN